MELIIILISMSMYLFTSLVWKWLVGEFSWAELVGCVNASAHFYTIVGPIKYDLFIF